MIKAILAVGENGEIGQNGDMPWGRGLPKDLEYFKEKTLYQDVVVGRNTFETLPFGGKGFPKRNTLVLTRNDSWEKPIILGEKDATYFFLKDEIIQVSISEDLWIAGGSQTYREFADKVEEYHITRVKHTFPEADTFFEPDLTGFEKVGVDKDVSGEYDAFVEIWRRK
jgi:dihydrofolate reductase